MGEIWWLGDERCHVVGAVGGKAANLSRLAASYPVPPGFVIPASATRGQRELSLSLLDEIGNAYQALAERRRQPDVPVAVRSSGVDEDGAEVSFAGQHETFLNVRGHEQLRTAVHSCIESASSERALAYRARQGLANATPAIAVLVQALIPADVSAVVFSANPINGSRDEVMINASWGLGESIVGGTVTPDMYVVRKHDLGLESHFLGAKKRMTVLHQEGTREVETPGVLQATRALSDEQVAAMAELATRIEAEMGWAVDLECAMVDGELHLLQCRPITTLR